MAEEFGKVVRAVSELTDEVASDLTLPRREATQRHFITTSRYEWMFWEMALRRETWPI